jgi:hypothetical protein
LLISRAVNKTISADKRLKDEEERAQEELDVILSRLMRIRRQRKVLRERGSELFARGVQSLDEMGGEDEVLAVEEQSAVGDAQAAGAFGVVDCGAFELPFLEQAAQGSAGDTGQASAGNALGV